MFELYVWVFWIIVSLVMVLVGVGFGSVEEFMLLGVGDDCFVVNNFWRYCVYFVEVLIE